MSAIGDSGGGRRAGVSGLAAEPSWLSGAPGGPVLLVAGTDDSGVTEVSATCAVGGATRLDLRPSELVRASGAGPSHPSGAPDRGVDRAVSAIDAAPVADGNGVVAALAPQIAAGLVAERLRSQGRADAVTLAVVVDAAAFESTLRAPPDGPQGGEGSVGTAAWTVRQVEAADAIVLRGRDAHPYETARGRALGRLLAPGAMAVYGPVADIGASALWRARRQPLDLRWRDDEQGRLVRAGEPRFGAAAAARADPPPAAPRPTARGARAALAGSAARPRDRVAGHAPRAGLALGAAAGAVRPRARRPVDGRPARPRLAGPVRPAASASSPDGTRATATGRKSWNCCATTALTPTPSRACWSAACSPRTSWRAAGTPGPCCPTPSATSTPPRICAPCTSCAADARCVRSRLPTRDEPPLPRPPCATGARQPPAQDQ